MSKPEWTPQALELFAAYAPHREPHRPLECNLGDACWVRDGPPSMSTKGPASHCAGCGGRPRAPLGRRQHGFPRT